jgi:hypothetical protein
VQKAATVRVPAEFGTDSCSAGHQVSKVEPVSKHRTARDVLVTSALDAGERSASRTGRFVLRSP